MTNPNTQDDEMKLKSIVFNELSIFELEDSSSTPVGTMYWDNIKQAILAWAEKRERAARLDEVRRILAASPPSSHVTVQRWQERVRYRLQQLTKEDAK